MSSSQQEKVSLVTYHDSEELLRPFESCKPKISNPLRIPQRPKQPTVCNRLNFAFFPSTPQSTTLNSKPSKARFRRQLSACPARARSHDRPGCWLRGVHIPGTKDKGFRTLGLWGFRFDVLVVLRLLLIIITNLPSWPPSSHETSVSIVILNSITLVSAALPVS